MDETEPCLECGTPIPLIDGVFYCEECLATLKMPGLTQQEIAVIGLAALALLDEIDSSTSPCLMNNGFEQTRLDLKRFTNRLEDALTPLLLNDTACLIRVSKGPATE